MASTRKFGIITSVEGLQSGITVSSLDMSENVETAEARTELGEISDIASFSRKTTLTVTGVLDTAKGDLARAGNILVIGGTATGKTYLITSVSKKQSNTTFVECTLTCETADNAEIYVVSSSSSSSSSSN